MPHFLFWTAYRWHGTFTAGVLPTSMCAGLDCAQNMDTRFCACMLHLAFTFWELTVLILPHMSHWSEDRHRHQTWASRLTYCWVFVTLNLLYFLIFFSCWGQFGDCTKWNDVWKMFLQVRWEAQHCLLWSGDRNKDENQARTVQKVGILADWCRGR